MGERRIKNCMPGSPELDYSSCRSMSQTCCPRHTTEAPPASVVRRMGRRRAASPGDSREHAKMGQASCCHGVHARAKSDGITIFPALLQSFYSKLDRWFEPVYSMAPQTQRAAAQEWELEARRGIYLRQCCH